jgi:hypothetical protein
VNSIQGEISNILPKERILRECALVVNQNQTEFAGGGDDVAIDEAKFGIDNS